MFTVKVILPSVCGVLPEKLVKHGSCAAAWIVRQHQDVIYETELQNAERPGDKFKGKKNHLSVTTAKYILT